MYLGIDIGTSGVRAIAIDGDERPVAEAAARFGKEPRDPENWRATLRRVMAEILQKVDPAAVSALAIDGTSGTLLAVDEGGRPLAGPIMYNEPVTDTESLAALTARGFSTIAQGAPGRAFHLNRIAPVARIVTQADWLSGHFSGRYDISDDNNTLKIGFDPESRVWGGAVAELGLETCLPHRVLAPGTSIGPAEGPLALDLGLPASVRVVAGTTDGCASFLASGATEEGDGVTALGSTLTLKLLSAKRIEDPASGVYSHRLLGFWLAGGASNSGGRVLAQYFSSDEIARLSKAQSALPPTGLDFYPLPAEGERFPINDPALAPRLAPRPAEDGMFLKALFEGMAAIEARGYARLAELGGPSLARVFTVGGGSVNPLWRDIRTRELGLAPRLPVSTEAAFGTARLARMGALA